MENASMIIANNIIYLRRKNGLTQQELAAKINYSDNAISRWERGEATPSVETLLIIANYFGVEITNILDENFPTLNEPKDRVVRIQRLLVILLTVSVVWTLALIAFVYLRHFSDGLSPLRDHAWLIFISSVPFSMLVFYYFNRLWGNKLFHVIILSVFWWSIVTSIYLFLLMLKDVNLWPIFLLGIPLQLAQLLWYFLRR